VSDPSEDCAAMFEASLKPKRFERGQTIEGTIIDRRRGILLSTSVGDSHAAGGRRGGAVVAADLQAALLVVLTGSLGDIPVPPSSMVATVRAAVRAADPSIPLYNIATMDEQVSRQMSRSRFTMWLMGVFAVCALMLAVVGIYGVMSYLVSQRTREIGIRLALGANGHDILRLVIGNGARLIAAGIAIGIVASIALHRLVSSLLFGVSAADSAAGFAVVILAAVAMVACYLPALRATRVSPLNALRYE
jgi:predicted lysophospholipase L1 biosynthesis ABC-type transport system permease subunit